MKKRTFQEFITLAKKRYVLLALLLLVISFSGIGALICILFQIILLYNYDISINVLLKITWLAIAIMSWYKLGFSRNLFVQGKLNWVFGDNILDDSISKKFYCKNENCNNEISKNRYYSIFTESVCNDCKDNSD